MNRPVTDIVISLVVRQFQKERFEGGKRVQPVIGVRGRLELVFIAAIAVCAEIRGNVMMEVSANGEVVGKISDSDLLEGCGDE